MAVWPDKGPPGSRITYPSGLNSYGQVIEAIALFLLCGANYTNTCQFIFSIDKGPCESYLLNSSVKGALHKIEEEANERPINILG